MAAQLIEHLDSRTTRLDNNGFLAAATLHFTLTGVSDDGTARSAAALASTTFNGLVRNSIDVTARWVDTAASPERGEWDVIAEYRPREFAEARTTEQEISVEVISASQHITQSIATISSHVAAGDAPDFKGAINVGETVDGVDTEFPVLGFTQTKYIADSNVTPAYINILHGLSQRVNDAGVTLQRKRFDRVTGLLVTRDIIVFAAGELKFDGFSMNYREVKNDWQFVYKFSASPNQTGMVVGDITGIAKKGWEYLWVRYHQAADENILVKEPLAAYVEKVYNLGDFSLI